MAKAPTHITVVVRIKPRVPFAWATVIALAFWSLLCANVGWWPLAAATFVTLVAYLGVYFYAVTALRRRG